MLFHYRTENVYSVLENSPKQTFALWFANIHIQRCVTRSKFDHIQHMLKNI